MTASWHLGTFRGIPIGLHWSMSLVFVLLTLSLATAFFPETHPGLPDIAYWVMAAISAVLFFGSILLHELGHSLVALRNGIPVKGITLFIFGGVAQIGGRAPSAPVELRIAAAGPAVSFTLAAIFGLVAWVAQDIGYIAAPLGWLASLNVILALFNLLPGFPLDGGRILRALVWHVSGKEERAARIALISGQILSFGLIGLGVFLTFTGQFGNGIWLIVIGWFLKSAATSEAMGSRMEIALRGTTVRHAMGPREPVIPSRMKLSQLLEEYVLQQGLRSFIVMDDDTPRGIVTVNDIAAVPQDRQPWVSASEVMTPWGHLATVSPDTALHDALRMMEDASISELPVIEDGRPFGLLSREDVLHYVRLRMDRRSRS